MAGIYVHIPYCKVKCHYCDFHFSTNTSNMSEMAVAICRELEQRSQYIRGHNISTIYFGGGTPSLMNDYELEKILSTIQKNFHVEEECEITIECNPDDIDEESLKKWYALGINRLSIGIQSFEDDVLKLMNRAHNSEEAHSAVLKAHDAGFENITVDLIYGIPGKSLDYWESQLTKVMELNVPHISSYCLTIEPKTVFGHRFEHGKLTLPSDENAKKQFDMMIEMLDPMYMHYEISNFAKEGFISKHNSAYWLGKPYLGIGPSAHSYDGDIRGWNVSNNHLYIKQVMNAHDYHQIEELTSRDKFNDYILTRLRTQWGVDLRDIDRLGEGIDLSEFNENLEQHLELLNVIMIDRVVRLSKEAKFIADKIASDLFV